MLFTFASLTLSQWVIHRQDDQKTTLLWGIAVGLLCYFSFATRTIGVVTSAAVLVSFLWQTRRFNLLIIKRITNFCHASRPADCHDSRHFRLSNHVATL